MEEKLNKKEQETADKKSLIAEQTALAERIEAANQTQKELLDRQEAINAQNALGGQSEAGAQPIKKEPLSDIEYAKAVMSGKTDPFKPDNDTK